MRSRSNAYLQFLQVVIERSEIAGGISIHEWRDQGSCSRTNGIGLDEVRVDTPNLATLVKRPLKKSSTHSSGILRTPALSALRESFNTMGYVLTMGPTYSSLFSHAMMG